MTTQPTSHAGHLARILFWLIIALVLGALAVIVDAQEPAAPMVSESLNSQPQPLNPQPQSLNSLPNAPKPQLTYTFLTLDAASRTLDVYSTHRMLAQGDRELFLPHAIASRPAAMGAVEAADILSVWWLSRRLTRRGHPRLAHWLPLVDAAQDLPWAVRNLYLPRRSGAILPLSAPLPFPKKLP